MSTTDIVSGDMKCSIISDLRATMLPTGSCLLPTPHFFIHTMSHHKDPRGFSVGCNNIKQFISYQSTCSGNKGIKIPLVPKVPRLSALAGTRLVLNLPIYSHLSSTLCVEPVHIPASSSQ